MRVCSMVPHSRKHARLPRGQLQSRRCYVLAATSTPCLRARHAVHMNRTIALAEVMGTFSHRLFARLLDSMLQSRHVAPEVSGALVSKYGAFADVRFYLLKWIAARSAKLAASSASQNVVVRFTILCRHLVRCDNVHG